MQPADIFLYIIKYIMKVVVSEPKDYKFPTCGYLGILEHLRRGLLRPPGLRCHRAVYRLQREQAIHGEGNKR